MADSKRYKFVGGVADGEVHYVEDYRDMTHQVARQKLSMFSPFEPPKVETVEVSIYTKRKLCFSRDSWDVMEFYAERSMTDREAIRLQFSK